MQIASRLPWSALGSGALLQAHVRDTLPETLRVAGLHSMAACAQRAPMDANLVAALQRAMDAEAARQFEAFADPRTLAVVTGQQPGCAGGPILVLLKAATAVALARRAARALARPVVPVFWNAADDVDFDEVARVGWPTPDGALLFLELPATGRKAQGFVGDLPATGDMAAVAAAQALLDDTARAALQAWLPGVARDHADWVARLLAAVFPELAVLDARLPALRQWARPLFRRYVDAIAQAGATIEARAAALAAAGFGRTLSPESARQGLFLVHDGQRHKVNDDLAPVRRALEGAPETLAPNVVLRPMVQDLLLPVVASVVGPAEIGYLHEIHGLRALLGVPEIALVPRLGMTLVDVALWDGAARQGIAPAALLADPAAALREAARRQAVPAVERARTIVASATTAMAALAPPGEPHALQRPTEKLATLAVEFERSIEDAALRALGRAEPALQRAPQVLRPRGKPQERVWAALWLLARWGPECGEMLLQLADTHLDAVEQGDAAHWIVLD